MAASSSADNPSTGMRQQGPDGQLAVIAIGRDVKVWIDKVKAETLIWTETEGQYPGYKPDHPGRQMQTVAWWYARPKNGWTDDYGSQTWQWTLDEGYVLWKQRAKARIEANAEQTLKKRQHDTEQEMAFVQKRIRNNEDMAPETVTAAEARMKRDDDLRRLRDPWAWTGTHDDDGRRIHASSPDRDNGLHIPVGDLDDEELMPNVPFPWPVQAADYERVPYAHGQYLHRTP
jgi:hypothetical protein